MPSRPGGFLRQAYHDVIVGIIAGEIDGWFFFFFGALRARAMISSTDSRSSSSESEGAAEGKEFLFC
jgi:hypothetical protein